MLSAQAMSDRLEIQDLLQSYCDAIDERNFRTLTDIFTEDAFIDYSEAGGAKGDLPFIQDYLSKALAPFSSMQHMIGLPRIKLNGDEAEARTICFNPMVSTQNDEAIVFFVGLWYVDKLVRTESGWRISERREQVSYFHNVPENFTPVKVD